MTDSEGIDETELERIRAVVATILHPVRSRVMSILALEPSLGVEELSQRLGVSAETVRRHIGFIDEAGTGCARARGESERGRQALLQDARSSPDRQSRGRPPN